MNQYPSQLTLKISLFPLTHEFFFFFLKEGQWIPKYEKEPQHDKTNKMICTLSEDSDQAGHPPRLISLRYPHEETLGP